MNKTLTPELNIINKLINLWIWKNNKKQILYNKVRIPHFIQLVDKRGIK